MTNEERAREIVKSHIKQALQGGYDEETILPEVILDALNKAEERGRRSILPSEVEEQAVAEAFKPLSDVEIEKDAHAYYGHPWDGGDRDKIAAYCVGYKECEARLLSRDKMEGENGDV